jgi:membrane-bound ClpP family serine protease
LSNMQKRSETSLLKAWLIVLVSLIDDAVVLALVLLGLWYFNVEITWTIILAVVLGMVGFIFVMHRAVVPAVRRRRVPGREGMIGTTGRVTQPLEPKGMAMIEGEYWRARSIEGKIESGEDIEVVGVNGLEVEVRRKTA